MSSGAGFLPSTVLVFMKKNLRRVFKVVVLKYVDYCFFFTLTWGKKSEVIQFDAYIYIHIYIYIVF